MKRILCLAFLAANIAFAQNDLTQTSTDIFIDTSEPVMATCTANGYTCYSYTDCCSGYCQMVANGSYTGTCRNR